MDFLEFDKKYNSHIKSSPGRQSTNRPAIHNIFSENSLFLQIIMTLFKKLSFYRVSGLSAKELGRDEKFSDFGR